LSWLLKNCRAVVYCTDVGLVHSITVGYSGYCGESGILDVKQAPVSINRIRPIKLLIVSYSWLYRGCCVLYYFQ